uniref:Uncharacterized protein n=1 Tax=Rhizophagus irregularis (strain DAOM 181602 / DAOM 197198 / MUCL 43194) TaxID=747089 RepID=U9TSZ0_RHIID
MKWYGFSGTHAVYQIGGMCTYHIGIIKDKYKEFFDGTKNVIMDMGLFILHSNSSLNYNTQLVKENQFDPARKISQIKYHSLKLFAYVVATNAASGSVDAAGGVIVAITV